MDKIQYQRIKYAIKEAKEKALGEGRNITSAYVEDIIAHIFEQEGVTEKEYHSADKKFRNQGEKGDTGIGIQGPPGKDGRDGRDGRNGRDGKEGKKGDRGEKGDTIVNTENVSSLKNEILNIKEHFDNTLKETQKKIKDIKIPQDYISVSVLASSVKNIVGPELNRILRSVQSQIFAVNKIVSEGDSRYVNVTGETSVLSFDGQAARTINSARNTTANTAGNSLTLQSGGATSGATDKNSGNLILASGASTGTGTGTIQLQTAATSGTSGTADNTPATRVSINGNGTVAVTATRAASALTLTSAALAAVSSGSGADASQLITFTGAPGQATSAAAPASGGQGGVLSATGGIGGAATGTGAVVGGTGGSILWTTGAGGAPTDTTGANTGGGGGSFTLSGGKGGNSPSTAGKGGTGGGVNNTAGAGGNVTATTGAVTGGTGGSVSTGAGGGGTSVSTSGTGGVGGSTSFNSGNGGSVTVISGTVQGGNGGDLQFNMGVGGSILGVGPDGPSVDGTGGNGGKMTFIAGAGGNSGTNKVGGSGGNIWMVGGLASTVGLSAGTNGNIILNNVTTNSPRGLTGIGTGATPGAQLEIDPISATTKGLIVKGATSQTANLLEIQNSSASVLVSINQNGMISGSMDTMTYAGTISLDVTLANLHKTTTVDATGNATINASATGTAGQHIWVLIINDDTSGKTITFGTNFKPNDTVVGTISKAAMVHFVSDGINLYEVSRTLAL